MTPKAPWWRVRLHFYTFSIYSSPAYFSGSLLALFNVRPKFKCRKKKSMTLLETTWYRREGVRQDNVRAEIAKGTGSSAEQSRQELSARSIHPRFFIQAIAEERWDFDLNCDLLSSYCP